MEQEEVQLKSKEPKQPKERKPRTRKSGPETKLVAPKSSETQVVSGVANGISTHIANGALENEHGVASQTGELGPSPEMIRKRAYELFVARGYEHGHHVDDWLAAERELKMKYRAQT